MHNAKKSALFCIKPVEMLGLTFAASARQKIAQSGCKSNICLIFWNQIFLRWKNYMIDMSNFSHICGVRIFLYFFTFEGISNFETFIEPDMFVIS